MSESDWSEKQLQMFNKLTRLLISSHDFAQVQSATAFLLEEVDEDANYSLADLRKFRCYETAMVVSFARPFSSAKGKVGRLTWNDTGLKLSPPEKLLDDKIMKMRNTLYGHSDAEFVDMRVHLWHSNFKHNRTKFNLIMPRFDEAMRFSLAEVLAINELTAKLFHAVFTKAQEVGGDFRNKFPKIEMGIE